jgi:hypothetical protein
MRKPTTAEVRLNEHKQRVSAQRGQHLAVWLSTKSAVIEFRCRGTPWGTEDRDQQLRYPGNVGSNRFGASPT